MGDIDKGQETQGFKLFGTTIPVEIKKVIDHDETIKPTDISARKADKTIPCPRCKSTETKFCYFNNYNLKQPRHFCKGCHRYWTAGGTLRNVPIGAGRRKTKPMGHGSTGFSNDCMFNGSELREFDFNGVVEQWHM